MGLALSAVGLVLTTLMFEPSTAAPAEPRLFVLEPRYRGTGLLVGAGIVGAAGIGVKAWFTVSALIFLEDAEGRFVPVGDPLGMMMLSSFYNVPIAASLVMLGGGMGMRGKHDAHNDLFDRARARRHMPPRPALGWGLFAGGLGLWATTRLLGFLCRSDPCWVGTGDGGYWASLALTSSGVTLGAYASGYNRYEQRFAPLRNLRVTPLSGSGTYGLSLSGRF